MSKRIRGITIELDGNVGPLSKALEGVNKQTRDIQTELKDVERLLKLDPRNTELLTQRKKLLAEAVQTSAERLRTLQTAQEQAAQAFARGEIGEEQYRGIQREVIAAKQELKALESQLRDVNDRFQQAAERVRGFGEGLKSAGERMQPLSMAAGAALGGIVALTVHSAQAADEINTLAKQTGLSTEQIQLFRYASERIDVPLETLTGSMAKLTRNMFAASEQVNRGGDSLTGAALAFDTLGVSVTTADGSLRNSQDVMADVIDALAAKTNATERDALAMAIFGKSAQQLNPLILGGADALKQMSQEAKDLGLILDQDALDGLNAFNDELDKTKAQLAATGSVVAAEFGKVLLPLLQQAAEFIQNVAEKMRGMDESTAKVILVVLAFVAAAAPLLIILGQVATSISAIIAIAPKITAGIKGFKLILVALTGPIGLIIAAVAALAAGGVLLIRNWDTVRPFFTRLWANVIDTFNTSIATAQGRIQEFWNFASERFRSMVSHIGNVMNGIVEAIAAPFRRAWEVVSGIADRIRDALNAINPFARQSPSLVDNVRAGVWAIQQEYAKLERLQLPTVAAMVPQVASTVTPAVTAQRVGTYHGPLVVIQNMTVRSDADVEALGRQLYRYIKRA